jgi:DEAD/DEAH box helicase domain-containing protein
LAAPSSATSGLASLLAEHGRLPLYGMPSTVRSLTHLPRGEDARCWPEDREYPSIERDIDLAIREFAPGQRALRDGRYWDANGLMRPNHLGRPSEGDLRPYDALWWLFSCKKCEANWLQPFGLDATFPDHVTLNRTAEEAARQCPCGAEDIVKPLLAVVPAGFKTDGKFRGADDESDDRWTAQDVAVVPEWSAAVRGAPLEGSFSRACLDTDGSILRINLGTDRDDRGFPGRFVPYRGETHGDAAFAPHLFNRCDPDRPESVRIALLSRMRTNQFWIAPRGEDAALQLDPGEGSASLRQSCVAVRASFESAAEILINCAARDLDISPEDEFVIGDITRFASNGLDCHGHPFLGRIHIADRLANGSGYSAWLYRQLPRYFAALRTRNENEYPEFIRELIGAKHATCQTSCYRCLRTYGTRRKHARLNWKFGLDLLRVLAGAPEDTIDWIGESVPSWWRGTAETDKFRFVIDRAEEFARLRGGVMLDASRDTGVPILRVGETHFAVLHPLRSLSGLRQRIQNGRESAKVTDGSVFGVATQRER